MIRACFSLLLVASALVAAAESYHVRIQTAVPVKMRDGVVLVADIYEPVSHRKFPVLVSRTPYSRATETDTANRLASNGYVVVVQDTRGRFDSEGEFYPFRYESQDGYDTIEWAAMLPSSNGLVGMFGASYVGATQWLAALASPPHLVAIFPRLTASEYYDGWTYQNGALMQWFVSSWTSDLALDTMRHKAEDDSDPRQWVWRLPLNRYHIVETPSVSTLAPYFRDWLLHERDDAYWQPWKISDHYQEINVKALHLGGWYDIFLKGTIANFVGMRKSSPAAAQQRLTIDARTHADHQPSTEFGSTAILDEDQLALHWFDYALKGIQNEFDTGTPVRLFIMGANVWRNEQEFPLARTHYATYYLHHRELSTEAPGDEAPDEYTYDPAHPVPTIGGRLCCNEDQLPPGPLDQHPNEHRPDVLMFSTEPLVHDVEVTGVVRAKVFASSSAVDTDFTALLADVQPNGAARIVTDGIVRARYRNNPRQPQLLEPGRIYEYDIDLWSTSNVFKAGHVIRLYISSSNFPRFNRNLNTGEPLFGSSRMIIARQKIYHDGQHLSAVVLPIIPGQ